MIKVSLFNKIIGDAANKPVKTPEKAFNGARSNLLLIVIFSTVNILLTLFSADLYFLFSASVPFYLVLIGLATEITDLVVIFSVVAFVIVGLYLLCWLLSKKHRGWLAVAMALFVLDTLMLFVLFGSNWETMILDIIMHAIVLYSLIDGTVAMVKLNKQAEMLPVGDVAPAVPAEIPAETPAQVMVNGEPIEE